MADDEHQDRGTAERRFAALLVAIRAGVSRQAVLENRVMALLLCDLDDTLVDRGRVFELWAPDFVHAHRLADEDLAWLTVLDDGGTTTREEFCAHVKQRFALPLPVEVLVAEWGEGFPSRYRCVPGVLALLREARSRGWSLGVVTNGDAEVQARKLAASGLNAAVDSICISGAEGVRKPDKRIFALAAERAGAPLVSGWMIGDDPLADIAGARGVGLRTIWVSRGRSWSLAGFEPDHQAHDPATGIRWLLDADLPSFEADARAR